MKIFGEKHITTAGTYYRLGVTLSAMGSYQEALTYAQKALEIETETLGNEHQRTSDSRESVEKILSNLAMRE